MLRSTEGVIRMSTKWVLLLVVGCSAPAKEGAVDVYLHGDGHKNDPPPIASEPVGEPEERAPVDAGLDSGIGSPVSPPDAGAPVIQHDAGGLDAAPEAGQTSTQDAGILIRCGILPNDTPIYWQTCGTNPTYQSGVSYIEWKDKSGIYSTCSVPCVYGYGCKVHFTNGAWSSGTCQ